MSNYSFSNEHNMTFWGLSIFYLIFFTNLIMDARSSWSLSYILLALALIQLIRFKTFKFNSTIVLICLASWLCITGLESLIFNPEPTVDPFFNQVSEDYIEQFAFVCIFACLPFLLNIAHFHRQHFEYLIFTTILFSLIYNTYLNFSLDFSRTLLAAHFKSVILYDYCIAALSLIGLVLSFQFGKKWSYILISVCLLNLMMIVLHGSRGAWIGLPIALISIAIYYFKAKPSQTMFMLVSAILLTLSMSYVPQSPIQERIEHLKSDTALIQEHQNYNSSVGTRLALWQFSWEKFKASPWIGQGITGLRNQICNPAHREAVPNCQPHAHNMILQSLAAYGMVGLIHLTLIYFYPFGLFIRTLCARTTSKASRSIAMAASIFMLYLGICGLSDYLFFFEFPTMFYFLMLITFLALLQSHKLPSQSNSLR